MKTLILALPRTGSTSLFKQMVHETKALGIFNPYQNSNDIQTEIPWDTNMPLIVKQNIIYPPELDINEKVKFYIEFASKFDKVRYLYREDIVAHAESFAWMNQGNEYHRFMSDREGFTSDEKYIIKREQISEEQMNWAIGQIYANDLVLRRVCANLGGKLEAYEDLFDIWGPGRYRQLKEESRLI